MKYFIFRLGIFFLSFFILIIPPIILISKYDNIDKSTSPDHNIISLQTKSLYDNLDILFIGNSYCYSSINTHIFDSLKLNTFNLGIATSGVQFYELLINDYYDHVKIFPKKVLILVTPMTFSSKSDNFDAYPIHRYLQNPKKHFEIAIKYNQWNQISKMYKKSIKKIFHNIVIGLFQNIFLHIDKENYRKIRVNNKGFCPSNQVVDSDVILNDENLYLTLKDEEFSKSKIDNLLNLSKKIKNKGSEVIFFELPTFKLREYFNNNYLSEYDKNLNIISKSYKLFSVNESLFQKENYRNIDHMNSSGAKIASLNLIKQLE